MPARRAVSGAGAQHPNGHWVGWGGPQSVSSFDGFQFSLAGTYTDLENVVSLAAVDVLGWLRVNWGIEPRMLVAAGVGLHTMVFR